MTIQTRISDYIQGHHHSHASFYNVIDAVVVSDDISTQIESVSRSLKKDFVLLPYKAGDDAENFLRKLGMALFQEKVIYIVTDTLKFHPIIYDQLMHIRLENRFTARVIGENDEDFSMQRLPVNAHIFLVFQQKEEGSITSLFDLTDHMLDLRKVQG